MPTIQIGAHVLFARQAQGEDAPAPLEWRSSELSATNLAHLDVTGNCFIFASSSVYLQSEHLRHDLSRHFQIPDWFWGARYQLSNGSFGSDEVYENDTRAYTPQIWSQYLVKQLERNTGYKPNHVYVWYSIKFWAFQTASGKTSVLCFDAPDRFRLELLESLKSRGWRSNDPGIYQLHTFLLDQIINLYDESVWALRDLVRNLERGRTGIRPVEPDFPALHDIARHAIHVSETLDVAIENVSSMLRQYTSFPEDRSFQSAEEKTKFRRTTQCFNFQMQTLKGLKARSASNQARMQNEITLAFNLVTQRDSQVALGISGAMRSDSTAMKTVAILTLTFLPATFVSAIFSTSFFDFSPPAQPTTATWTVSNKFWIYWAFAAPLTIATVVSWFVWQRWYIRKSAQMNA
ncbi:hypothetical protein GJ744_002422 [Endocarpon pusillum]|uniref:Uncharacterized protein n=1 Tax=Endocarpon pusillum TaxID=364733 RepID=A0A8H7AFR0_9EURO|nr:hypothetical protein GJ744_002422 [Endocarpon pusillum]